ncbi:phosphate ABC transporter substrate-binding protein PstS [Nitrogeniibacter mangrovi]|uniref:Phosphate-binding protein PstS n=2 Tax=Nitrogeniibacter mangrovi TaxID=2016596 RepID=A0A6C1BAR1_9RHOO|nr:phosphate ABC transporter substrate-binding protein PstS [Nitrogeniibacter mangrovi]
MRHAALALLWLPALACAQSGTITGAGSSAASLVYQTWGDRFAAQSHIGLDYAPVGSSAGLKRIIARDVGFGASDVAPDEATLRDNDLVLLPTVVTGAVPVVNLPAAVAGALRLDGPVLARLYMREITRWNDPAIARLNPGLALPDLPVTLVVRGDGSGTTYNFTDYLAKVSDAWRERFGVGKRIDWASGSVPAKGSSGVVAAVQASAGALGYVDYTYVLKHHLAAVRMKNRDGRFVAADLGSFRAALAASPWQSRGEFGTTLTEQPGADSWPITMGTFVLLPRRVADPAQGAALVRFFTWSFMHGDELAATAHFVRLPDAVQAKAYRALAQVTDAEGTPLAFGALAQ